MDYLKRCLKYGLLCGALGALGLGAPGFVFGLGGGVDAALVGAVPSVLIGGFGGIFLGWFISTLTFLHGSIHAAAPGARPSTTIAVHRVGVVQAPFEETFSRCVSAVRALGATVDLENPASGCIRARTRASLRSWGERIEIQLRPAAAATHVSISSEPSFSYTLIDYGKGLENVERIIASISDGAPPVPR